MVLTLAMLAGGIILAARYGDFSMRAGDSRRSVAAGLLYPLTGTLISPIWASAAMTFSSVSVIGNALRLRRAQL